MEDTDLYADVNEHNGVTWDNDVFELFFKPADDKPGYYEFQVNAAGTMMELFLPRRGAGGYRRFKEDGDFHVEAKVNLRGTLNKWTDKDDGWSVEGRIPWKDFLRTGGRPEAGRDLEIRPVPLRLLRRFRGAGAVHLRPLKTQTHPDFHYFEDYATLQVRRSGEREGNRPAGRYGIDKRVPLTTSKVVGSPDRRRRIVPCGSFPNLKMNFPIAVVHQPGSDRLLLITESYGYGPTKLQRMKDDPERPSWKRSTRGNGVAYSTSRFIPTSPRTAMSSSAGTARWPVTRPRKRASRATPSIRSRRTSSIRTRRRSSSPWRPTATTAAPSPSATTACSTSPPATARPTPTPTSSART